MGANRDGLYLAVFSLFRLGHPPLFIPWSEITLSDRWRWLMQGTQFTLGRQAQIPIWVFQRTADRLLLFRPSVDDAVKEYYSWPGMEGSRPSE